MRSSSGLSSGSVAMVEKIAAMQDFALYRDLAWEGSFEDYLQVVRTTPQVTRNAFQRAYDMIIRYGTEEYTDNKKKLIRYNFFKDERTTAADAVFGLDIPLMRLVHVLARRPRATARRSASSSSTARGLVEVDDRPPAEEGPRALLAHHRRRALHLRLDQPRRRGHGRRESARFKCPMHEEPLRLIPPEWRAKAVKELGLSSEQASR
jgi:serine protein kinase